MARNYQTKANVGALPDTITATRFGAGEFNSIAVELENAVTTSDQTLAPADGTGEVTDQLAMALAIYGAGGAFYHADTGAVNAYVLTPISPKESPPAYFDGFTVIFEAGTVNTTASTVNVNSLGVKNITYSDGNALIGGELSGSCGIKYNLSDDRFELLFSSGALAGLSPVYVIDASQADQGVASSNPDTYTVFDAATAIGTTKNATLYFPHNPVAGNQTLFTFDTSLDLSSYPNLSFKMDQGAQFDRTTGDEVFTVYSFDNFLKGSHQTITTANMLSAFLSCTVRPETWGAIPDGVTDSTNAIQYAVTAAKDNGTVLFDAGTYFVSSTITFGNSQHLIGNGWNSTIIKRTGDYGDTFYSANSGASTISGFWFVHATFPSSGFVTLDNIATTGSHLHLATGQDTKIENCWFWRMPFSISIDAGAIFKIDRCNFNGAWNIFEAAAQEGLGYIILGVTGYSQLVDITNCYFGGVNSGAQSVNFTISDNGVQNVNFTGTNGGAQNAITVYSCEGLRVENCYLGGNSFSNILLAPNDVLSQVNIQNNFFDGAGYADPMINISPQADGQQVTMIDISNNHFNGEQYAYQSIGSNNAFGVSNVCVGLTINANTMMANLGSGIFLRYISGCTISDNTIFGYNSRNLTPGGDVNYCNGIYITESHAVLLDGNLLGGAINSAATGSFTYRGVDWAGTNTNAKEAGTIHNGTGTSANKIGRMDKYVIQIAANHSMTGLEDIIVVDTTTASWQIALPSAVPDGWTCQIKDGVGNAGTFPFQIVGTVEGVANPIYNVNWNYVTVMWDGSVWLEIN